MEKHKINCKTHDSQDRVIDVGFDGKNVPISQIHDMIKSGDPVYRIHDHQI